MLRHNQNGFAHVFLLIFILMVVAAVGFGAWRVWDSQDSEGQSTDTVRDAAEFKREGVVFPDTKINNIEVIKLPDGKYRMFYHDTAGGVKSAISSDGRHFTLEPGIRIERGVMSATVRLPDDTWRMYYVDGRDLKSATSQDAYEFTSEPGVRLSPGAEGELDHFGVVHPRILELPDGSYKLYYDGHFRDSMGPDWRIMSASSKDGLTWVKDKGSRIPVDSDPNDDGDTSDDREVDTAKRFKFEIASHGNVIYEDGKYVMYFGAQGEPLSRSGIWRATSDDGINFGVEKAPVLARDPKYGDKLDTDLAGGPRGMPEDAFLLDLGGGKQRLFFWTSDKGLQSAIRAE
ncbi:MAG TPA: hypothetical protein VFX84_01975 [Candidatus Saccharimonadales bacterium]|nr:hypothetical protein [Candidatus Saccharimonadales bacterium]